MDIMCASVRMRYERMFAMFDIDGDGSVSAEEVSDALQGRQIGLDASELDIAYHYQQLLSGHMSKIAAHMDETQAGVVPSMDLAAFCEALERDHHQGRAWFVTGVAVNLPDGGNFREVARTVHLEQAAVEFDDKVRRYSASRQSLSASLGRARPSPALAHGAVGDRRAARVRVVMLPPQLLTASALRWEPCGRSSIAPRLAASREPPPRPPPSSRT